MSRNARNEVLVGALLIIAAGVFVWLAIQIGAMQGLEKTIRVTVRFNDAAGLVPDSAVKVAGVAVGAVKTSANGVNDDVDRFGEVTPLRKVNGCVRSRLMAWPPAVIVPDPTTPGTRGAK